MISKPSSKGSTPMLLRVIGEAAGRAGEVNTEARMTAAGDRARSSGRKRCATGSRRGDGRRGEHGSRSEVAAGLVAPPHGG